MLRAKDWGERVADGVLKWERGEVSRESGSNS